MITAKMSWMICLEEMMNKFKMIALVTCVLTLTACTEDKYVSVRHNDSAVAEVTDKDLLEPAETTETEEEQTTEEEIAEVDDEEIPEVTDEMLEDPNEGIIYTVGGVVNIRMAPSENSEIIGQANPGEDIVKLGDSDNWSRVNIDGVTGYIRSDLLQAR